MNGYDTLNPCDVCGRIKNNKVEPRFLYTVCEDHYHVRPVDIKT